MKCFFHHPHHHHTPPQRFPSLHHPPQVFPHFFATTPTHPHKFQIFSLHTTTPPLLDHFFHPLPPRKHFFPMPATFFFQPLPRSDHFSHATHHCPPFSPTMAPPPLADFFPAPHPPKLFFLTT